MLARGVTFQSTNLVIDVRCKCNFYIKTESKRVEHFWWREDRAGWDGELWLRMEILKTQKSKKKTKHFPDNGYRAVYSSSRALEGSLGSAALLQLLWEIYAMFATSKSKP